MAYKVPFSEPIAIVGSGCRFAGNVQSPSKLWDLLIDPPDLTRDVPRIRFNPEGFYHPDGEYHGTTNSVKAYWLEQDHRVFDAGFFKISNKEVAAIDPQQRMLLEVVYEAMESAGYTLHQYADTNVSVFVGIMTADYDTLSQRDDLSASQYYATGNARSIISNRISYFFNFHGPSMTIDTACSSSLVALHQAVLSLRAGESVMACVAGANLMITPEQFIVESSLHMLSPTGKSRMWDADADGYARGEGIAALLLKPLSRALLDGDEIIGIVRETGVNSDGRTPGITLPNPLAQATLIKDTYRKTGLNSLDPMDRCQYFEAHGTGTQAGDPREASAIHQAFFSEPATTSQMPPSPEQAEIGQSKLLVGSVKTVIGHTEGAAGLAGVLKVVQGMRNKAIPPNLHLKRINPSVEPYMSHLEIPTTLTKWPRVMPGQPMRASVNSFGFGGTNSHAILEGYDPAIHNEVAKQYLPSLTLNTTLPPVIDQTDLLQIRLPLVFSATYQKPLVAVLQSFKEYLDRNPNTSQAALAWALYSRKTPFEYRLAIPVKSTSHAIEELDAYISKVQQQPSAIAGTRARILDQKPRILGIFTGQGAQWPRMGRSLFLASSIFRDSIRRLDDVLKSCSNSPSWSIEHELVVQGDTKRMNTAEFSQPLCTAVQIALIDLIRSVGVSFHAVVGHSSGEIAAAYAAGVITAREAILISYNRGTVAHLASGQTDQAGGMVAVGLSRDDATKLCEKEEYKGKIWLAASNAPSSVTLSGDLETVEQVATDLVEGKKFARQLVVDTAYHSPHMSKPATEYMKLLNNCEISPSMPSSGAIWVSSVYGNGSSPDIECLKSTYWKDNMVQPVLFKEALEFTIINHGPFDFAMEIGPHPALKGPTTQTFKATTKSTIQYTSLLDRTKDDLDVLSDFLAFTWSAFDQNVVNWQKLVSHSAKSHQLEYPVLTDLPTYAWDHSQIHYKESRISRQYHQRTHPPHELLGVRTRDDSEFEMRWRNIFKLNTLPWVEHHKFQGQALFPASGYCVLALEAAKVLLDGRPASVVELEELEFMNGIPIDDSVNGVEILFSLNVHPPKKERRLQNIMEANFTITSADGDGTSPLKMNFCGKMRIILNEPAASVLPSRPSQTTETLPISTDGFYNMMTEIGLDYTGPFRALDSISRRYDFCTASLKKYHPDDSCTLQVSPATLDSCFQSAFAAFASPGDK
jgi:acyl transferase domain-containing protein